MQKKVQIVDRCDHCHGQAYIFECEATNHRGEVYDKYKPCPCCHATGKLAKWIALKEFVDLLLREGFGEAIKSGGEIV